MRKLIGFQQLLLIALFAMSVSLYSCSDPAGDEPDPEPEVEEEFHGPIEGVYTAVVEWVDKRVDPVEITSRVLKHPDDLTPEKGLLIPAKGRILYFAATDYGNEILARHDTIRFQILKFELDHTHPFHYHGSIYFNCIIKPIK